MRSSLCSGVGYVAQVAAVMSHAFAEHVAAVKVPKEHELVPDTVYPALHVGWHVDPLARELVHVPTPPFAGAADASQKGAGTITLISMLEDEIELKTVTQETSEL